MGKRDHKPRVKKDAAKGRDSCPASAAPDPRVRVIARAIGRLIAREQNAAKAAPNR